ncbi:MAG: molybdenum cofactor guanylyltransferase [Potamolinea sp.]
MSKIYSLSAIILAGGQSSRMGRDKALIPLEGVPLLQHICEVALHCASPVYVVTPCPEKYKHILPETCLIIQEFPLLGETESHGPLVGFAQGLTQVETDWVLLLACDLPQLQRHILQDWATELENVPPEAIALLSHQSKGWEPLCGFWRRQSLPLLTNFINQGGRSFQQFLAQHLVQELPVSDTQVFFNCNTPADLELLTHATQSSVDGVDT